MGQVIFFYLFCLVVCCFFRSLFVSYSYLLLIASYKNIFLEQLVNKSTAIDNSVVEVIKSSNKISLTKNIILPEQNIQTSIVATKELGYERNTKCIWPKCGYFQHQPCDLHMEKENYPENSVIYWNQGYLTIKDNKKCITQDFYILGQINECKDPPEDTQNYVFRPRYDSVLGQFQGLYETLGFIVARGDSSEHFLGYSYTKEYSKLLHSYHKRRIPSSFSASFLIDTN